MKNKLIIILTVLVLSFSLVGCNKKNDTKEENKEVKTQKEYITNGELTDEITWEASKSLAEQEGIPMTKEALLDFYKSEYATTTVPENKIDLQYNLSAIENIIGQENILRKISPEYVMSKLKVKKTENVKNMDKETLEKLMSEYADYMDTMGITESSREEYVKNIYLETVVDLEINQLYEDSYKEATYNVMRKYNQEYIDSLNLK